MNALMRALLSSHAHLSWRLFYRLPALVRWSWCHVQRLSYKKYNATSVARGPRIQGKALRG